MNLRDRAVSGVGWTTFARLSKQLVQFVLSIILMRLLVPDDYGLIGMAMVFIGFASIFKEFGFGSAIIQRSHLIESHYSSTFYLNILIGLFLTALFYFTADNLALFYGRSELTIVLKILAFDFIIAGFGIVPRSIMLRNMKFQTLAKIDIIVAVLPSIIAVIVAISGFGVLALVIQTLVGSLISVVSYQLFSGWLPKWKFSFRAIKDLTNYSANLTGFQIINYFARNTDDFLIGKYMGSSSLGVYTRAYTLMMLPISQVISIISNVMFSTLSKIQKDKARVKRVYLKAMKVLAFLAFPMMVGLFVVTEPFVLALFGNNWIAAVPLLKILSIVGLLQSMCNPTGWIYQSQGKTDWLLKWGLLSSSVFVSAIIIGVSFGDVKSVAIAYTLATLLLTYPCIVIPGKLIDMSFKDVFIVAYPSLLNSIFMGTVVYLLSVNLPEGLDMKLVLLVEVLTGIICYVSIAGILKLKAFNDFIELMKEYSTKIKGILPTYNSRN